MSNQSSSQDHGSESGQAKALGSKRGRPRGKKTERKPVTQSFESVCPTCGKTGAKVRPGSKARNLDASLTVGGVTYNHVKVDTVQCSNCPQVYARKTYGIK